MKVSNRPILVSVVMITYAHEAYLKQAIEGVLNQVVDFELELILANDDSPDNTDSIVKSFIANHPKGSWIRYFKHPENKGMQVNFVWALNQAKGDFIALCDGDDYWTDKFKLSKQIEFLLANENIDVCGTYCNIFRYHKLEIRSVEISKIIYFNFYNALAKQPIPTFTMVFRNKIFNYNFLLDYKIGDVPLLLEILRINNGIGALLPFNSGVYVYHGKGAVSGNSSFNNYKRLIETKLIYLKKNNLKGYKIFFLKELTFSVFGQLKHIFKFRYNSFDYRYFKFYFNCLYKLFFNAN
jgi:glycosyltransferase involved in cell wall biosynthesis